MGTSDDTALKLRIRRILWVQGYHCPLEVDLSHFGFEGGSQRWRRTSLTDIDVLGIRYESDLRSSVVVADCKSGKESEPNRIFWLKGVMDFFDAQEAYFVKTKIGAEARSLAPRLGIRCADEAALRHLEDALNAKSVKVAVADPAVHKKALELWGIDIEKGSKPTPGQLQIKAVYQYLQYYYWMVDRHRNIQSIVEQFARIGKALDPYSERSKYLAYVGLERLTLSIIEMASAVAARDLEDVKDQSRLYLFGGPMELRQRKQMLELINELAERHLLIPEKVALDPPYFEELVEIVNKIIAGSPHAWRILQILDAVILEGVLQGDFDIEKKLDDVYSLDALVLLKRIAILFQKQANIDKEMFADLVRL